MDELAAPGCAMFLVAADSDSGTNTATIELLQRSKDSAVVSHRSPLCALQPRPGEGEVHPTMTSSTLLVLKNGHLDMGACVINSHMQRA